ncbi:hypothetical protein FO519_009901 [Halicephalobus sp. NKZ332]|nr:hypothetical protein FO519_009901 [Halicephalobus sp. NKZ332]
MIATAADVSYNVLYYIHDYLLHPLFAESKVKEMQNIYSQYAKPIAAVSINFFIVLDISLDAVLTMNRFTALVLPLRHKKIWSFYPSLIVLLIMIAISALLAYMLFYWDIGYYFADSYFISIVLLSGATVVIILTFAKKSTHLTPEIMRVEKLLLYQTAFMTFWLVMAQVIEFADLYLVLNNIIPHWLDKGLYATMKFCVLISKPGSLLLLLYLSTVVRTEFRETFELFCCFISKREVSPASAVSTP